MPSFPALMPALRAHTPEALADEIADLFKSEIGWELFTLLKCDHTSREVVRLYSSNATEHPVGGRKPFNPLVLQPAFVAGQTLHICRTREEIARSYASDPKALAYTAAMNIPVVWDGMLLGLLNLLRTTGKFPDRDTRNLLALAALSLPLFIGHYSSRC